MSAQDNLSPDQFETLYHGTSARLNPGELITPGRGSNHAGRTADLKGQYVYATPERQLAHKHAVNAVDRVEQNYNYEHPGIAFGETKKTFKAGKVYRPAAPRIYEVSPTGPITRDPEADNEDPYLSDDYNDDHPSSVRSRKPLKVTRRVR